MTTASKPPVRDGTHENAVISLHNASVCQNQMGLIVRCPDAPENSASIVLQRSWTAGPDAEKPETSGIGDGLCGNIDGFAQDNAAASCPPS